MAETRKDKRAPVSLKVRFKSATVDEFIEHYSKDVSRGGIYIKSSQPMPVGTLLKFQFQLKDESALIRGVGRVVWTRVEEDATADNPAGMGIKFIKMDNESRSMVERIIDAHADERGTYEEGRYNASSAEPSSSPPPSQGGGFFPDLPPAELPLPEDRTAVRHATEFLAAALSEGGADEGALAEAQKKAEEARKRSEEVEAQRREEAEAKKRQEAEARASLRPKPPEAEDTSAAASSAGDDVDENEPTPRSLPSMIIDPSLGPRTGRPSEQSPGSEVTPLPRPTPVATQGKPASGSEAPEPDTEPPPPPDGQIPRSPTTSIPQVDAQPKRSILPMVALALVLLVAAIAFLRGRSHDEDEESEAIQEPTAEPAVQPAEPAPPAVAPEQPAEAVAAPEPTVDAQVKAAPTEDVTPKPHAELVAVDIATMPRGAEVWVGEEKLGPAPVSVKLPVGDVVVIRALAKGFAEAREELTPAKNVKLNLKLTQLPYLVHVESTPPGAAITVGAHKGVAPLDIPLDPPPTGMLAVHAKLPGYTEAQTKLKLDQFSESDGAMRAQLTLELQASLPKDTGKEAAPAPATPKEKPKKAAAPKKPEAKEPAAPAAAEPKAAEAAPVEAKPEAKPAEPKAEEPKPEEPKPAAGKEPVPDNPF